MAYITDRLGAFLVDRLGSLIVDRAGAPPPAPAVPSGTIVATICLGALYTQEASLSADYADVRLNAILDDC